MSIRLDDGFQFGLGMFETICVINGVPLLLDHHMERLNHSLKSFGINQTVTSEEVTNWLEAHLPETAPERLALKIMVSSENKLFVFRGNPYSDDVIAKGFRLDYSPILRNETSPLVSHKSMNYGDNIIEKRRTHTLAIDEVVFLNTRGELTEGSTTNIFFVKNGQIYTPPLSCGLLPGVLRRFVMEHFSVCEKVLYPEDVPAMDECFVTNSLMGIMPVTALGNHPFREHTVTESCINHYRTFLIS